MYPAHYSRIPQETRNSDKIMIKYTLKMAPNEMFVDHGKADLKI